MSLPTSKAAILYAPSDIRVENRPVWPPSRNHVQVAVRTTGLCGSDLHYYSAGRNGDFAVRAPLVLGHEASGVITALGPGVTHLHVGQRVAIEAGIYCRNEPGDCEYCASGRYNLCKRMRFASSASRFPHTDGTLQERMNHPAFVVHPIGDDVTWEMASLAEPLSVLVHAARRAGLSSWRNNVSYSYTSPSATVLPAVASSSSSPSSSPLNRPHAYPFPVPTSESPSSSESRPQGPSVLVFGVGPVGLLACALARYHGASKVCAVDINKKRLEWALKEGFCDAIYCVPSTPTSTPTDGCCGSSSSTAAASASLPSQATMKPLSQALLSHFAPLHASGFSLTFECTGSPSSILLSVLCSAPGSKVLLIGMGARDVNIPIGMTASREIDLVGVFRYADCYGEALEMLSESASARRAGGVGRKTSFPKLVSKLVTHRYKLEDTHKAFELVKRGVDDQGRLVLKVIVGSMA